MTGNAFHPDHPEHRPQRRGFVLLAVLVFVMLLSMIAMSLLFRFKADETASAGGAGADQAWATAMSGVQEALRVASQAAPGSNDWRDNRRAFRERLVHDDGSDRWFFTIYAPADEDSRDDLRYGLTDEASRLNVNFTHEGNLAALPEMKPALAEALRDFVDFDDTARTEGAEQEYYAGLPRPYAVRNGPLATLDEIRLVRGFTAAVFLGEDSNMNGRLDPNENDGDEHYPPDNNDGRLDRGLRQYLTVASYDPEVDNSGAKRTNLNDPNARLPDIELPPPFTNYLAALHASRQQLTHPADVLEGIARAKDDTGKEIEIHSGVGKDEIGPILDRFTATKDAKRDGLININTASLAVLATVPGIDEPLAEAIASTRKSISPENRTTIAWLVREGVVDAQRFKSIAPYITARSFQFSFQVVGYGVPSGRFRVLDVMIDVAGGQPRITYLRDLTRLGLPFPIGTGSKDAPPAEAGVQQKRVGANRRLALLPPAPASSRARSYPSRKGHPGTTGRPAATTELFEPHG